MKPRSTVNPAQHQAPSDELLVLASHRELRRRLFDAFDRHGHARILSARDVHHAMILIEGRPPPALRVVAFEGDGRGAADVIARWQRESDSASAPRYPVLAVLADDFRFDPSRLPEGIADWLHADQIESELVHRAQRACRSFDRASGAVAPLESFLGEQIDTETEWLVIDRQRRCIVAMSPAVTLHSGLPAAALLARPLSAVLALDDAAMDVLLGHADGAWHGCARQSASGADSGQARRHLADTATDVDRLTIEFRGNRADLSHASALNLLSRLARSSASVDPQAGAARTVIESMSLDYLALWSASEGSPRLRVEHGRDTYPAWSERTLEPALAGALAGQRRVLLPLVAAQVSDDLPDAPCTLAAVSLLDGQNRVCGALLLGRHHGFGHKDVLEPLLHGAAAHFSHLEQLALARSRSGVPALHDALTELPNRLLFEDRLDRVIREALRSGECFAVLLVDMDQLELVNRTYSMADGDHVLHATARRLEVIVRASDTLARFGGDKFVIVLRNMINAHDVLRVAEKIVQTMAPTMALSVGSPITVSASIGISFYPDDALDARSLLDHADQAVRAAKAAGGNRFVLFEGDVAQFPHTHVAVLTRLRHAQQNGELRVVYQPQIDTLTEEMVGMEALVRWAHPELGELAPGAFIPLAEQSGLIVAIGLCVLRTACLQAQIWQRAFGLRLRLGVNLSAVQLMQNDLLAAVAAIIEETGFDPELLELEITESISIKEAPNLVENLHGLHRLGCRIAIDDFGTGAASLDYLRRLPADRIKIDQSFVRNIGVDPDDEAIVRATIDMAHRLNREVIAEGVETEQHLAFLRANDCDEVQGYLFARPLSESAFTQLLHERHDLLAAAVA